MYLLHGDTIELENSNHVINNALVEIISEVWSGGIQKQSEHGSCFKLKLKGYPFSTQNGKLFELAEFLCVSIVKNGDNLK